MIAQLLRFALNQRFVMIALSLGLIAMGDVGEMPGGPG